MSNQVTVTLLPTQEEALKSTAKNTLVTGGLGAGKTAIGVHFVIKMINEYPNAKGLICANTYKQLNNATLTALEDELKKLGFRPNVDYTRIEGKFTINNVTIITHSLEAYEVLAGQEFGWAWIDEAAFAKEEAYRTVKERVRQTEGPCQILLTTTTNGFNWLYDRFVTGGDGNHVTYKLRTKDNFFLPVDYYDNLVEQYGGEDTPLARQQLFGEFVNLTSGQVYNYFDESRHLQSNQRSYSKLYIGLDFNIGNMNAVVCEASNTGLKVIDEICLTGSAGTQEMAIELKSRYGVSNLEIIPDATGKARKTSSSTTDHQILTKHGFILNTSKHNPFINDRQQELNHCFLQNKLEIHPKCKNLISELNKLTHEDDEGKVAHLSVALGYVAYRLNVANIRSKPQPSRTIRL